MGVTARDLVLLEDHDALAELGKRCAAGKAGLVRSDDDGIQFRGELARVLVGGHAPVGEMLQGAFGGRETVDCVREARSDVYSTAPCR